MSTKQEMKLVKTVFPDAEVFEVAAQYENFHAIVDGVRMIFYPHTVRGTGNSHTRVRNGTPKLEDKFAKLVAILTLAKPINCTFSVKNKTCRIWEMGRNYDFSNSPYQEYYRTAMQLREKIYPAITKETNA